MKKASFPHEERDAFKMKNIYFSGSKFDNVLGLWASIALFNFKTHPVTLAECLKSGHFNTGMMNKQVLSIFLRNETKSFSVAKPFYNAFSQSLTSLDLKIPEIHTSDRGFPSKTPDPHMQP